jgi:hypothetical protein
LIKEPKSSSIQNMSNLQKVNFVFLWNSIKEGDTLASLTDGKKDTERQRERERERERERQRHRETQRKRDGNRSEYRFIYIFIHKKAEIQCI